MTTAMDPATTTTTNAGHTMTLPWVAAATTNFVQADLMREAISLALSSGQNLIFSGPGGHGKSEFVKAVLRAIKNFELYVKSLNRDTAPDELYGGVDLKAFRTENARTTAYNTDDSFLCDDVAVFEEIFDASGRALASLKDTMTDGNLRNGRQIVPMRTSLIIGLTNWNPNDFARDESVAALVERFAIQLEVKWETYDEQAFAELFDVVLDPTKNNGQLVEWQQILDMQAKAKQVEISRPLRKAISWLVAELRKDGAELSPRTAALGLRLIQGAAVMNGRDYAILDDVRSLVYLPGCGDKRSRILQLIEQQRSEMELLERLMRFEKLQGEFRTRVDLLATRNEARELKGEIELVFADLQSLSTGYTLATQLRTLLGQYRQLLDDVAAFIRQLDLEESEELLDRLSARLQDLSSSLSNCETVAELDKLRLEYQTLDDELNLLAGQAMVPDGLVDTRRHHAEIGQLLDHQADLLRVAPLKDELGEIEKIIRRLFNDKKSDRSNLQAEATSLEQRLRNFPVNAFTADTVNQLLGRVALLKQKLSTKPATNNGYSRG